MQRIDVASAVTALPAPAAAGTPGYFTDGDVVGGEPATVFPADFANMLQEELMAVVLAAALAPSKTDHGQVLEALGALFGISGNLAANGHIIIPVGNLKLIVNWGSATQQDSSGGQLVTFDQPYTAGVFQAFPVNRANGPPAAFHGWAAVSLAQMKVFSAASAGAAAQAGIAFSYVAIGV